MPLVQPLGSLAGKKPTFEASVPRRSRSRRNTNAFEPTEEPIPKFGNFEDTELKEMVADGAQIISITDDYVETSKDY